MDNNGHAIYLYKLQTFAKIKIKFNLRDNLKKQIHTHLCQSKDLSIKNDLAYVRRRSRDQKLNSSIKDLYRRRRYRDRFYGETIDSDSTYKGIIMFRYVRISIMLRTGYEKCRS